MRVQMLPTLDQMAGEENGIKRVIEAWTRYGPQFGIEWAKDGQSYDLKVAHAGIETEGIDICHSHGTYWTADYQAVSWEYKTNARVIDAMRQARKITCPSEWVAETIRRDMRRNPTVIPHGIDWRAWQHDSPSGDYVLWTKNRNWDVCDPEPVGILASAYPGQHIVSTFAPRKSRPNIEVTGVIPHDQMKLLIQGALVYLSTTKETFGIGTLEAMAAGVPILGAAWGGNMALVQHGINGYLAQPGNADDLIEGLAYCLRYRDTLGANGRELAKQWTWEAAMEKLVAVYEEALKPEAPTVAVIIPSYNYADKVARAVQSVMRQTYNECKEIVVVDDGSNDGGETERIVAELSRHDARVIYLRQENQGVAVARNHGIANVDTKYVCCLDADDALEPDFLTKCVRALERDNSLGIAYTGLRYVLPDGKTGVSPWPGDWNFDDQLRRKNQVPTCCVYRREIWEATGGYKKRYCPQGAGSEDAEFWTRCGAYGWKAAKVTPEPLFIYSWQSGRVSGNKEYSEPDWLAWHPWATDGQHPFGSYATAKRFSHPVRQYDEPVVSVIIPVGPGHVANLEDALDSLEAQTFRKWEAIVVFDCNDPGIERIIKAYPYVRFVHTGPEAGAGAARNLGAEWARAPFLLFLDADDWLYPHAIQRMVDEWKDGEAIIYSDYVGKAFIANPDELAPNLREKIIWRMPDGLTAIGYQALDYEPERAQAQPVGDPGKVYTWNLITSLIPKAWHDEVRGFDETLPSWEDVDYWWRLAKKGKCFQRIREPLVVYHFYSGGRRDQGVSQHRELFELLRNKHERLEITMCSGCGRKATPKPATPAPGVKVSGTGLLMADSEFKLCVYLHPNRGQHPVIGSAAFVNRIDKLQMLNTRDGWKIHYGFRGGGERFLVHVEDIRLAPHLFREIEALPKPPDMPKAAMGEPMPIGLGGEEIVIDLLDDESGPPAPRPIDVQAVMGTKRGSDEDLQKLPGVTPRVAAEMKVRGINDIEDILDLGESGLLDFDGIGPQRAHAIYMAAMERAKDVATTES